MESIIKWVDPAWLRQRGAGVGWAELKRVEIAAAVTATVMNATRSVGRSVGLTGKENLQNGTEERESFPLGSTRRPWQGRPGGGWMAEPS